MSSSPLGRHPSMMVAILLRLHRHSYHVHWRLEKETPPFRDVSINLKIHPPTRLSTASVFLYPSSPPPFFPRFFGERGGGRPQLLRFDIRSTVWHPSPHSSWLQFDANCSALWCTLVNSPFLSADQPNVCLAHGSVAAELFLFSSCGAGKVHSA